MHLTAAVDIPDQLLEAARSGDLVLFVGAGASRNWPSDLPLFDGLAREVALNLGETLSTERPDQALGELHARHRLLKEHISALVQRAGSQPNDSHRALVRLALASGARIVSTNYDLHLETAAAELGKSLGEVYSAPALPLGASFDELIYLHGSASKPADRLVVTDEDFGRAYLTEGWARRFVQDLFLHHAVLFVGYSHNDVVMTYLARGLPPSTQRYVLTDEPHDSRWKALRITPIEYSPKNDHAALPLALDELAEVLEMGALDHYERARELASGQPPKDPALNDYLSHSITTPTGARGFAAAATGYEWLRWIEALPVFKELFDPAASLGETGHVLSRWFAQRYVEEVDNGYLALGAIARNDSRLSPGLAGDIGWSTRKFQDVEPEWAARWAAVLISARRPSAGSSATQWYSHYRHSFEPADLLALWRRVLVPHLELREMTWWFHEEDDAAPRSVTADVVWDFDEHDIDQLWQQISAHLPRIAHDVLQITEQAVRDADRLGAAFAGDDRPRRWYPRRSAIEPHAQDHHREAEHAIIDALRDSACVVAEPTPSLVSRWLTSEVPLLRRVGLHVLIEVSPLDAESKVRLALSSQLLYDHETKHEFYRLLERTVGDLNVSAVDLLVTAITAGPPQKDPVFEPGSRLRSREIFDLLEWMSRHGAVSAKLDAELAGLRQEHPDMGVREHPDIDMWMTSGTWDAKLPESVDELLELAQDDGEGSVAALILQRDYSERDFSDPSIESAMQRVTEVVKAKPSIGFRLVSEFDRTPFARHADLISAVIRGWANAVEPADFLTAAVASIDSIYLRPELATAVAWLCVELQTGEGDFAPDQLSRLEEIATRLWSTHAERFDGGGWSDPSMMGLNTWPGYLARFWLYRISNDRTAAGEDWLGPSRVQVAALESMLTADGDAHLAAISVLAMDVRFVHAVAPVFTREKLFRCFESERTKTAAVAWESFLHSARVSPAMLDDGFWAILKNGWSRIAALDDSRLAHQYWDLLAQVTVSTTVPAVDRVSFINLLADSLSGERLSAYLKSLGWALTRSDVADDDDLFRTVWNSWLQEAMLRRFSTLPGVQPALERSGWGDLALTLESVEMLAITTERPGPLTDNTNYRRRDGEFVATNASILIDDATARLRLNTSSGLRVSMQLEDLVEAASAHVDESALRPLVQAALAVGITTAYTWLRGE